MNPVRYRNVLVSREVTMHDNEHMDTYSEIINFKYLTE